MKTPRHALVFASLLALLPTIAQGEYDHNSRLWAFMKLSQYKEGKVHVYSWAETRWQDSFGELGTWWLSEKLSVKLSPNWDMTLAGTYLETRKNEDVPWRDLKRAEFELNPNLPLNDHWKLRLRNRLEVRWWEDASDRPDYFTRHRIYLNGKGLGPDWLKSVSMSNEFFYDWESQRYVENRFYPVDVKLGKAKDPWQAFLGLRSRRGDGSSWTTWAVVGVGKHFSLPSAR